MFHRIDDIIVKDNFIIIAKFETGEIKKYDLKRMMEKIDTFKELKKEKLYKSVKIDIGGYGIVCNDHLDLSSESIWENGTNIELFE